MEDYYVVNRYNKGLWEEVYRASTFEECKDVVITSFLDCALDNEITIAHVKILEISVYWPDYKDMSWLERAKRG